jgi:hypothetical protein
MPQIGLAPSDHALIPQPVTAGSARVLVAAIGGSALGVRRRYGRRRRAAGDPGQPARRRGGADAAARSGRLWLLDARRAIQPI